MNKTKRYLWWSMLVLLSASIPLTLDAAKKHKKIDWGAKLTQAVEDYDVPLIKKLLKKSQITENDKDTAKEKAKEYGYKDIVKLLKNS